MTVVIWCLHALGGLCRFGFVSGCLDLAMV